MATAPPRVLIVGAGFGGMNAARALGRKPVEVLLLDRHNYHLFQPLLYQVATAGLEPEEIAYPVRRILNGLPNVDFRLANVRRVDLEGRQLETDIGQLAYDYLILAAGSENNYFGLDRLAQHSQGLKNLDQAVALRNHVLRCFERATTLAPGDPARQALLTFAIGGGGPTGVEFAGALSELVHLILRRDYKNLSSDDVHLVLVEGSPDLLGMVHPRLRRAAERELKRKGVEVRLGLQIKDYDGQTVALANGDTIQACTLLWSAGVRSADIGATTGLQLGRHGGLPVTASLQLPGHPEVFAIGDLTYLEQDGKPLPMLAPVAIQQAQCAADNILLAMAGQPPKAFRYRDKGTLATIGRNAAVAQFGPVRLSGFIAWVTWLLVHLVLLIGFRNRVIVLINWAWNYFSFERALRLITDRP